MLTLVQPPDQFADAHLLRRAGEVSQSSLLLLLFVLLPVLAAGLWAAGHAWACPVIGAAVALALSRYGPHWWPGRR